MPERADALVAGIGEIGGPLADLLETRHRVASLDVDREPAAAKAEFLHVCYPFQIPDFVGTTTAYAERFDVAAVIVHSTVVPGTTEQLQARLGATPVFYSPVRGKHVKMHEHLRHYRKFLAGPEDAFDSAAKHLSETGLQVEKMAPVGALEMAKLLETTYFGVLIAWAQEAERYAQAVGSDYETVIRFVEEIPFLPEGYWPGFIGGHCVMPNIDLLGTVRSSEILDAVKRSNEEFARANSVGSTDPAR